MSKIMELADTYAAADAEEHYEMNFGDQKQFNKATYNKSQARAALAAEVEKLEEYKARHYVAITERDALRAELDEARKELNTLDVMLEECKMDWSGDVTQIKAEHKHEVDALREKLAIARNAALEEAAKLFEPAVTPADAARAAAIRALKEQK